MLIQEVMLLGPVMDSMRAASILKNLRTLHIRMKKHSENAKYLSEKFLVMVFLSSILA